MGSLWLNIRFGAWHLRGIDDKDWWKLHWNYNNVHAGKPCWNIELYELCIPKAWKNKDH